MALGHAPTFAFDNILNFIDPFNPRCFDGTSATMYVNGSLFTTFTGLSNNQSSATDTKVFDFPGCDGAIGQLWFNMGQAISAVQAKQHFYAFRRRFGIS